MNTATIFSQKTINTQQVEIEQLKKKAALWDEFTSFIEDKILGGLMELTENEKNISLSKAKKALR